jgi:hypothetical protein
VVSDRGEHDQRSKGSIASHAASLPILVTPTITASEICLTS